jgi:hypothetical protein
MGGYLNEEDVPPYRTLQAELKFLNPMRGWCPIAGAAHERACRQCVAEISALLEAPPILRSELASDGNWSPIQQTDWLRRRH